MKSSDLLENVPVPRFDRAVFSLLLTVVLSLGAGAGGSAASLLHVNDFEGGVIGGVDPGLDRAGSHSAYVVSDPVRSGRFAVRFELRPDDPMANLSYRSELTFPPDSMETERWYALSLFVPRGFTADPVPDIVAQWHGIPDADRSEPLRHPPLRLRRRHLRWELTICSDDRPVFAQGDHRVDTTFVLGPVEEHTWTDWVFHVRWSHGAGGFVRAWKNGEEVVHYEGPVGFDDRRGPYFKWGIYKPAWKYADPLRIKRVLYFDEIRSGTGAPGSP